MRQLTGETLDPAAITLGVARRAATYKRHHLLLSDPARLGAMSDRLG
ncbi:MAG: hypothetical protein JNL62_29895, partial [Bryobacterales bacterium]|nr:hypothetical protein [Bryobacterales bacterium]